MARRTRRSGFSLTEVLTVIAIVGLVAALLIPAVQRAREKARHLQCRNNLKQIGLALHNYHEAYGRLPSGFIGVDAQGQPEVSGPTGWGWAAMILPQLDQQPLFNDINFSKSILDPANASIIHNRLPVFRCPSDSGPDEFTLLASDGATALASLPTANYVGNFGEGDIDYCNNLVGLGQACTSGYSLKSTGVFYHNSSVTFGSILDGNSQTLMVSERSSMTDGGLQRTATWLGVVPGADDAYAMNLGSIRNIPELALGDDDGFSSSHTGVVDMLMADGHVDSISIHTSPAVLTALASRSNGDGVGGDSGSSGILAARMGERSANAKREQQPIGLLTPKKTTSAQSESDTKSIPKFLPANQPGDPEFDDHFIFPLPNGGHGAWHGATPDTVGPIVIKYDFRALDGFQNSITAAQKSVVEAAAKLWSDATCGKVVFQLDSAASRSEIVIIGVGSLQALGVPDDGQFGILGVGGGSLSGTEIINGFTWMDVNEQWDTTIGNGDPDQTSIDFFTVLAHEFGHSIGLGHLDDMVGDNMMNSIYDGEQTNLSSSDIAVLELLYGTDCDSGGPDPGPDPGGLPPGWVQSRMTAGNAPSRVPRPKSGVNYQSTAGGNRWIFELRSK